MDAGITEFSIRILLLFLPGIICSYLLDALTVHRSREPAFFIIRALVLGFASYFSYWVLFHILNGAGIFGSGQVYFLRALVDPKAPISFHEILYVCGLSVILGVLLTVESTYKLTHRVFRSNVFGWFPITNKFGELDVWGYALNLPESEWVTVRDLKEDLVYDGWIEAFSDDGEDAELLLREVEVYRNSTGVLLYEVPVLYVSRDRKAITLEFRAVPDKVEEGTPPEEKQNATPENTPAES